MLPDFTLAVIYYAVAQCLQIATPSCDETSAELLTTFFGIDSGSIKKCLEIFRISTKRKGLTETAMGYDIIGDSSNSLSKLIKYRYKKWYISITSIQFCRKIGRIE